MKTALALSAILASAALAQDAAALLDKAKVALTAGNQTEALSLATQAVEAEPQNTRAWFVRARLHAVAKAHDKAIADYSEVVKLDPKSAEAWQRRGEENFRLGRIAESIADFDQFIALTPAQAPHHWQRGISLYYAGRFADGRRQFESHQTVNPNDVENAVWHFLCVARYEGVERARAALIPISGDRRVPMAQVHDLFAGKAKPEDVLKAARAGGDLEGQLFYAHLYLGIYFEALGDEAKAKEFIFKAAGSDEADHYMGDVARVHAARLREGKK